MVEHTQVNRRTTSEDRIAMCPQLGCEMIKRVKPLKFGFFGFGKYPKCKHHHLPLVYVDERIGKIVDAALACLFDKAGLPPKVLLIHIKENFPKDLSAFIKSWVYCITIGRGGPIISSYMDSLSNSYLKEITKKQLKALKDNTNIKSGRKKRSIFDSIKIGMDEITLQYTRLLKHLRAHFEVFVNTQEIISPSTELRNALNAWLEVSSKEETELLKIQENQDIPLSQVKDYYDRILNIGTCRCLLGLSPERKNKKERSISAFDRFSAYFDFWMENLTEKFTKSNVEDLKNIQKITTVKVSKRNKWDFLDWNYDPKNPPINKKKHPRSYYEAIKNAADYLIEEILTIDFRNRHHILDEEAPLVKDLKVPHGNFVKAFQNRGLKYYHIIKEAGLKIQDERQKVGVWDQLNWNQSGNPRVYKEGIKNAAKFFLKNIFTEDFKRKNQIIEGIAPKADIMYNDEKSKTFFNAYHRRGLHHNDIMKKAGLLLNKDDLKWEHFDWNKENIPRSYREAVENAAIYLNDEILTEELQIAFNLGPNEAPTVMELEIEHKDFISAIYHRNMNYNDILKSHNYEIHHDYGKWDFLSWDDSGIPQSYDEATKKASQYFLTNIMNKNFIKNYELKPGLAPDISILKRDNNDFVIACRKRKLHFREIFKKSGYKPTPRNDLKWIYPHPQIANLNLVNNIPNLKKHLKEVFRLRGFPDFILNRLHQYPRISSFKGKLTWIRPIEKKKEFIEKCKKKKKISFISFSECKNKNNTRLEESICTIIRLCQDKNYDNRDFYSSHESAGHEYVLPYILKNNPHCIGIEIPIWKQFNEIFLTGHIDLIQVVDDIIIVADYKPDETPLLQKSKYTFLNSIPQVSAYGLIIKDLFKVKQLLCVTFNKKGAWIYNPHKILKELNRFVINNRVKNIKDRPWEEFFNLK